MSVQTTSNGLRLAYSPREIAEALGLSSATIARRLKDRKLPSVLFGGRRLVPTWAVAQLLDGTTIPALKKRLRGVRADIAAARRDPTRATIRRANVSLRALDAAIGRVEGAIEGGENG